MPTLLVKALPKPAKGPGGRPAHNPVKMFKLPVLQRYSHLPAANTLWDFREALVRADVGQPKNEVETRNDGKPNQPRTIKVKKSPAKRVALKTAHQKLNHPPQPNSEK